MNIPDDWNSPYWENATRVHDWRNYASEQLKEHWDNLTDTSKKVFAECLQNIADHEEWD